MKRLSSSRRALVALLAILLVGGAVAAIAATGSGKTTSSTRAQAVRATLVSDTQATPTRSRHVVARRTVAAAAQYLGTTISRLRADLRSGKSLAQLANESSGKSEAGLIAAVEKAQRPKIAKAVQRIEQRAASQVQKPGSPRAHPHIFTLKVDAEHYLGLTAPKLRADERAGKSLAQIAQATPGKSEAGLVQAILAAREQQYRAAVKAGKLSASGESARIAALQKRLGAYVHHVRKVTAARPSATR